jgi:hypothetical protein
MAPTSPNQPRPPGAGAVVGRTAPRHLWSVPDVSHADAILTRLRAGTMPCDGAWPAERIEAFERWIAAGTLP